MADAILPKGKAENIPKAKNTTPRMRNLAPYLRRDLARYNRPIPQKARLIQSRGRRKKYTSAALP